MSQNLNTTSKKPRRVTRAQRNHPVLVTSGASEQEESFVEETPMTDVEPVMLVDAPPVPKRRIAGFFSTVGKDDTATQAKEADVAKARLARATHGKISTGKTTVKEVSEIEKKPAASKAATGTTRAGQAQKPKGLFKPRYIFGMIVYLIAADFLGGFEKNALTSIGAERILTKLNLFGFSFAISSSGLLFIVTLIIILVVLVRLDFLPTSMNALSGGQPARRGTTSAKNTPSRDVNGDGSRPQQLTMKQGVQGADDDLYRAYRTNQRRDKKR